jgi:diguanylate cyclase (GGDEF)-like protein
MPTVERTMIAAPAPPDEKARLEALEAYEILDTLPEQVFDDLTFLAATICDTPIALISLVDRDRQWFKSRVGLDVGETPRDVAFCAHAILSPDRLFVVPDAERDRRFADNPLVEDGTVRFYAGAPLRATADGSAIGTLCVIDRRPRHLDAAQEKALAALSRQVIGQLELRKTLGDLRTYQSRLEDFQRRLVAANEALAAQRYVDGLTGIANRMAFDARIHEELHRAERYRRRLSLLLCDLDHFKACNDSLGHTAGDAVLRTVARLLEAGARTSDFVARFGGEEFVVILPETGIEGAMLAAERLRHIVAAHPWERHSVTISIGASESRAHDTAGRLLERSDGALYEAKKRGRNRVAKAP